MTDTLPTTSTATVTGQDAVTYAEQNFPSLAWMLGIPELSDVILNQIVGQGITDTNQIQSIVENTSWWRNTSQSARAFIQLEFTDPTTADQQINQESAAIQATFSQLGLNPSEAQVNSFSYAALMNGWTTQQLVNNIGQSIVVGQDGQFKINPNYSPGQGLFSPSEFNTGMGASNQPGPRPQGGQLLSTEQQLQQLASQYMVNVSPQVAAQWSQQIATGQATQAGYQAYLQQTASSAFPWMAQGIKEGQTPLQLVDPYSNMVANELGISPHDIDWTQPKWAQLLTTTDPKTGQLAQMPLWQATNQLRSNPTYGWQYTPNAKDAVYSFIQGMQQTMGFANYSGTTANVPGSYGSGG